MKIKDMSMYKKNALLCALLCVSTQYALALTPWLEIKPSYFFFYDSPMKHIYNKGGYEIQASVSVPVHRHFDVYGSIGGRHVSGHALNTCEDTSLTLVPIDIGLKPIVNFCERFYYFFAMGPRFFYFHQKNESPFVDCSITSGGVGLFINSGFNVLIREHFLLGIFGEYSYEKKKICPNQPNVFSNGSVQIGGLAFGVSLGYAF
jgi:hypothetical protein